MSITVANAPKQVFDSIFPDLTKKDAAKLGSLVAFTAGYGAFEYYALQETGEGLKILASMGVEPVFDSIYPYHLYLMMPIVIGASAAIGFDKKSMTRNVLNFFQTFPMIAMLEDIMYFVIQGTDPKSPRYGMFFPTKADWTAQHYIGATELTPGGYAIPNWYLAAMAIAGTAWTIDNIVLKKVENPDKSIIRAVKEIF